MDGRRFSSTTELTNLGTDGHQLHGKVSHSSPFDLGRPHGMPLVSSWNGSRDGGFLNRTFCRHCADRHKSSSFMSDVIGIEKYGSKRVRSSSFWCAKYYQEISALLVSGPGWLSSAETERMTKFSGVKRRNIDRYILDLRTMIKHRVHTTKSR